MSVFLTSSAVISVALVGAAYALWARFRPRMTFRRNSQTVGETQVFDGAVDVTMNGDQNACLSGYICYIRRARQKGELPTVLP